MKLTTIMYPLNLLTFFALLIISGCEDEASEPKKPYRFNASLTIDGLVRTYILNLPPNYYDGESDFPLVIGMHGTGGSAAQFEYDYHFTEFSNEAKFIVVYPEGVQSSGFLGLRTWNAGNCCDYALDHQIDDVKFIRELINELVSKFNVDSKRVYVTGMSNGGMMAYRLACEIPEKIAAIATVSCSMVVSQSCNPSRAVPILHIHSVLDSKIPYLGGIGIGGYYFPPLDSVLNVWSANNLCASVPQVLINNDEYKFTKWTDCKNGASVEYYLTQDGGHAWPGGLKSRSGADSPSKVINANELIWDFFQRFELP
jgi:polyhydroxybutyrate depolymerase